MCALDMLPAPTTDSVSQVLETGGYSSDAAGTADCALIPALS